MTTYVSLRQIGVPAPDTRVLENLTQRLGPQVAVYGGYLRDLVLLGDTSNSGDIDAALGIEAFLALKPVSPELADYRRHFVLHEPHLLFMLHQDKNGVFAANDRPYVLALKPEYQADWGLVTPLGLTLTREAVCATDLTADADLGFTEIVWDGAEILVSAAFVKDMQQRTMTLRRAPSAREYARTLKRVVRFKEGRYHGWSFTVPPELARQVAGFEAELANSPA
jgi:hypothetical protein